MPLAAPVAQLDRVTASEAVGCAFEPRRAHDRMAGCPGTIGHFTPRATWKASKKAKGKGLKRSSPWFERSKINL